MSATGKYIAFCDDDDIWFPKKLELQIEALEKTGCKMSSTNGLIGAGIFNPEKNYKNYSQIFYPFIQEKFKTKGSKLLDNGYPDIWDLEFLKIWNCVVCSSVVVEKDVLMKVDGMPLKKWGQDYACWLNILKHTNSVFVRDICFYYDKNHADGRNH